MDIKLDSNSDITQPDDITIVGGDFVIAESTEQHQKQLLISDKGSWKENPSIGVGYMNYIDAENGVTDLAAAIKTEYTRDGMEVSSVTVNNNIKVEADYV